MDSTTRVDMRVARHSNTTFLRQQPTRGLPLRPGGTEVARLAAVTRTGGPWSSGRVPARTDRNPTSTSSDRLQSRSYTGEVVITMPHRVILKHELTREWGIGVERHRSGLIEFLVAERTDCRGGGGTVAPEQIQRLLFRD